MAAQPQHINFFQHFKNGFIGGLGWSFGVTIGFVLISTIIVSSLRIAGGLPLVGEWIAGIVTATQESLIRRNPYYSR